MLQLLKNRMEPLLRDNYHGDHSTNRILSPISGSDNDSMPDLVTNNGDNPIISRYNEEPPVASNEHVARRLPEPPAKMSR